MCSVLLSRGFQRLNTGPQIEQQVLFSSALTKLSLKQYLLLLTDISASEWGRKRWGGLERSQLFFWRIAWIEQDFGAAASSSQAIFWWRTEETYVSRCVLPSALPWGPLVLWPWVSAEDWGCTDSAYRKAVVSRNQWAVASLGTASYLKFSVALGEQLLPSPKVNYAGLKWQEWAWSIWSLAWVSSIVRYPE